MIQPKACQSPFNHLVVLCFLFCIAGCVNAQQQKSDRNVGGPCEGCEALFEYGELDLVSHSILPGFDTANNKLIIDGTVFQSDRQTLAKNVILYFYHTNADGIYLAGDNAIGWKRRHGALRGWAKTREDGSYQIKTSMPASYPDRSEPAHIHITVKEEGLIPYYIDAILFDNDPLLTQEHRNGLKGRGGNGIVSLNKSETIFNGKRDIILGLNIPGY